MFLNSINCEILVHGVMISENNFKSYSNDQ